MKPIVVPTDFSPASNNAARYALRLAVETQSNISLCNAMLIPMDAPMAVGEVWPLDNYDSLKTAIDEELLCQAEKLKQKETDTNFHDHYYPKISYKSEIGDVTGVVRNLIDENEAGIVVMGMSGAGGLSRFFFGSKSHEMIEHASVPVLLIPAEFIYKGIKRIAFATDLSVGDIEIFHSLTGLAKYFNAEILITHITDKKYETEESEYLIDTFLSHVSNRVNYPNIYYRNVKSMNIDAGLNWLTEHSMIDMLAMVHRPHDLIDRVFTGSHTQKLAKHVSIPLLVLPNEYRTTF